MSKNWATDTGSPLKTKPCEPSDTCNPISPAALRKGSGRGLEILNSVRARSSGKAASLSAYSILTVCRAETWQLNKSTFPSLVERERMSFAIELGSPSVDSPSVKCKIVGGKPCLCSVNHWSIRSLTDQWLTEHKHGFPPTILHLTDGESTDGDPSSIANDILSRSTSDGNVLLFNCHVSARHTVKIEYADNDAALPDDLARTLFKISSPLPDPFRRAAGEIGLQVSEGSHGFVFNGDPVSVAQFFDIGTRPANLR